MSENPALGLIENLIESIGKYKEELEQKRKEVEELASLIQQMVYGYDLNSGKIPPEFEKRFEFRTLLDKLHRAVECALHLIIKIEIAKKELAKRLSEQEEYKTPPQQIIVQTNPERAEESRRSKGFWESLFDYIKSRRQQEMEKEKELPDITENIKVRDMLEYGRQLLPSINELKTFYGKCFDKFRFFRSPEAYFDYHRQIEDFVSKLIGIIGSFTGAYIEMQKDESRRHSIEIAKSISVIAQAEAMTSAGQRVIVVPEDFRRRRLP